MAAQPYRIKQRFPTRSADEVHLALQRLAALAPFVRHSRLSVHSPKENIFARIADSLNRQAPRKSAQSLRTPSMDELTPLK